MNKSELIELLNKHGNQAKAAKAMGVTRSYVNQLVKKHGIKIKREFVVVWLPIKQKTKRLKVSYF